MKPARLVALLAVAVISVSCDAGSPSFSDSASAGSVAFSGEADRIDIAFEKCPGDPVPEVSVSEDADGPPVKWDVTERVSFPDGAFFIARRPAAADGLPPVEEANLSVVVETDEPVHVAGLRIGDLPASDGPDVLTAEGEERPRSGWRAEIAKQCKA